MVSVGKGVRMHLIVTHLMLELLVVDQAVGVVCLREGAVQCGHLGRGCGYGVKGRGA